ncbi:MAG: hypothetical protein ABIR29_00035 [Chthoniobacterales bacterium]
MEYIIAIFLLGLIVTFVVAKGVMMSHEFAAAELDREIQEEAVRLERTQGGIR